MQTYRCLTFGTKRMLQDMNTTKLCKNVKGERERKRQIGKYIDL